MKCLFARHFTAFVFHFCFHSVSNSAFFPSAIFTPTSTPGWVGSASPWRAFQPSMLLAKNYFSSHTQPNPNWNSKQSQSELKRSCSSLPFFHLGVFETPENVRVLKFHKLRLSRRKRGNLNGFSCAWMNELPRFSTILHLSEGFNHNSQNASEKLKLTQNLNFYLWRRKLRRGTLRWTMKCDENFNIWSTTELML